MDFLFLYSNNLSHRCIWSLQIYKNSPMKPGPSPFIIIPSIYSMKTGCPYMILQSRMLPLTRTDLLFSTEEISVYSSKSSSRSYSHYIPYSGTESIPPYFFHTHSSVDMSYIYDRLCCSVLIYEGAHFSRLWKTETVI